MATILHVANLDVRATEAMLVAIFSSAGGACTVKMAGSYAFVDFESNEAATAALCLDGRRILENEVRVNWAHKGDLHRIFIGDLPPGFTDAKLRALFDFPSLVHTNIVVDPLTNRCKYAFCSFACRPHAEEALLLNGTLLSGKKLRVNWAANKPRVHTLESISAASPGNCVVYFGNLGNCQECDVRACLADYKNIVICMHNERGFAFVTFESHRIAANAIFCMQTYVFNGRQLRVGWRRDCDDLPPLSDPIAAAAAAAAQCAALQMVNARS